MQERRGEERREMLRIREKNIWNKGKGKKERRRKVKEELYFATSLLVIVFTSLMESPCPSLLLFYSSGYTSLVTPFPRLIKPYFPLCYFFTVIFSLNCMFSLVTKKAQFPLCCFLSPLPSFM